jgi:hypothetical protein
VRYPDYDWFDCWHELFVHARSAVFFMEEADGMDQASILDMRGGFLFRGALVLNRTPEVDFEDVVLTIGSRLEGRQLEAFFECDYGRGQESFLAPSLFYDQIPNPRIFVDEFRGFFDRSFVALRVTDSWCSALSVDHGDDSR